MKLRRLTLTAYLLIVASILLVDRAWSPQTEPIHDELLFISDIDSIDASREADLIWIREEFLNSKTTHDKMVVHGHSIARKPQVRANRIGIDTGAFTTGVLTCLALNGERREILQTGRRA